ncbi:major capsid protein [Novosphingobium sp. YJ-S2-02]|uniref:Major capsid protein n=1 Tax=Novosphingobium aureum TaxID=2792964 RepID=A0A931HD73_9SPHN|nr:major capsid protein [Novosphingobium aureum]MBH0113271.1 major capsid protein [Novosphingobium aureum]
MGNPYELWTPRKSLGMFRDTKPEEWYFGQYFTAQMRSTDEYIDFEKLPIRSRKLAPFVKPLGRGHGVFSDEQRGYRFKPANVVVEDPVDPLRPLTFQPGIGESRFQQRKLTPMQRLELIKAQMLLEFQLAVERRWEWMKAKAIIDGKVTCTYKDGSEVLVDFRRDAGHTETLTAGNRFGDSGVSILDKVKAIIDTMTSAEFGGVPDRITIGTDVAPVWQADEEIMSHMDINLKGGVHSVDRGILPGSAMEKVYKLGELAIAGGSGRTIEIWVNGEDFQTDTGVATRYLGAKDMVVTARPSAIMGYECFGMIVDPDAEYEALPMFPKNYTMQDGRVKVEHVSIESAPLFVPINPNATYKVASAVA